MVLGARNVARYRIERLGLTAESLTRASVDEQVRVTMLHERVDVDSHVVADASSEGARRGPFTAASKLTIECRYEDAKISPE